MGGHIMAQLPHNIGTIMGNYQYNSGNIVANQLHKQTSQLKTNYKTCTSWMVAMQTHGVFAHMKIYINCKKIVQYQFIFNNPNLLTRYNYNATLQKLNIVDYMQKYGVYKLLYMKHMQNYNAITKQLVYFLTWKFIY